MKTHVAKTKISLRFWWMFLLSGAGLILLGTIVLLDPSLRYSSLSLCITGTFFVNGFIEIFFSLSNRNKIDGWRWYLVGGVLDLIIGSIFLTNPVMAAASLPLLVGIWLLLRSMLIIARSLELKHWGVPHWQWLLFFGMAGFIFAWTNISNRLFDATVVVFWTGTTLLTAGLFYLTFALFARHLQDNSELHFE